ncbi:hypothetical protein HMPREF9136_1828 [Prevotella dentalis DSM 3688]|uniref:Uncharacterized protein n=1 Tax=Prevotella dentalis (strain ATCC 49559 / DSM 3688 / JCM 13448 / NCTC 12043 / ES 2772) TaxID=908937 RepID=F9D4Q0_PREDD|nr:hypothetical protein HMPREF9136_1828 [Prevotella dentalis DSM 3688]
MLFNFHICRFSLNLSPICPPRLHFFFEGQKDFMGGDLHFQLITMKDRYSN